jgi:hypothetical protein
MKPCDHFIGFLSGEQVYLSTLSFEVKRVVQLHPVFKKYGLLNGEPQTKEQVVDGRKGYFSRFKFCPYCGEKLNFKEIFKTL